MAGYVVTHPDWAEVIAHLPKHTQRLVRGYLNLSVAGIPVACPYWMNRANKRGVLGGKGTPEELQAEINKSGDQFDQPVTESQARQWLKQKRIGVDCSGLAYQILSAVAVDMGYPLPATKLVPTPGGKPFNPVRFRINADYLTSQHNSRPVDLPQARLGDLIRMDQGRHVMVILQHLPDQLIYIHSSAHTQPSGVHLGRIKLVNLAAGLAEQAWQEVDTKGRSLVEKLDTETGTGIWRLKFWP